MTRWRLGDVLVLRHAGFPFDWLEALGLPDDALVALDAVLEAEDDLVSAAGTAADEARAAIAAGRAPSRGRDGSEAWAAALRRWERAREEARAAVDAAMGPLRARLREVAADPRVQEAVFLSNPDVHDNVWRRYVSADDVPDNSRWRRVQRQVYSYIQRFCAKNETTSFFGPMGYGESVPGDGFEVGYRPDPPRRAFFSLWAVRALEAAVGDEPELWLDLPARPNPLYALEGTTLVCEALGVCQPLPAPVAALLEKAGGAGTLRAAAEGAGMSEQAAAKAGRALSRAGALRVGMVTDEHRTDVFEQLRDGVAALPAGPARDRWVADLDGLDAIRGRFSEGGLEQRRAALAEAEERFARLTGEPARRGAGRIYADRLILYEEAASPFELRIGEEVLDRLAGALSGGLELSAAYGDDAQRELSAGPAEMLRERGGRSDLLTYVLAAAERHGDAQAELPPVEVADGAGAPLALDGDRLGRPADGPRYALPDVCLAATSPDQVARGEAEVVLARVHHHLLVTSWLATFHPRPERFDDVAAGWLRRSGLADRLLSPALRRRNKGWYRYPGRQVELTEPSAGSAVAAGELEVSVGADGRLRLTDADGRRLWLYLPLADFVAYPPYAALSHPPVLHARMTAGGKPPGRVQVGGAVYQRRRWAVETGSLAPHGFELMLALRRLRREHGLPRFAFARVAGERKPFLVDTASPFAALLLRHLAGGGPAELEEMLPGADGLWLRDPEGRRYTAELRVQAEREGSDGR